MRAKSNRLLMLLVGAAIAGCASQTDRSSSGGGDQIEYERAAPPPAYEPEQESVQFVDRPLEPTPPPPKPVAAAPKEEAAAEFPITKYELPEEQDEQVEDLGTQEDESVSAEQEAAPEEESSVGETTEYAEEDESEEIEDLGTQDDESVSAAQEAAPEAESSLGETTEYTEQEEAEVVEDLGPQQDDSGTVSFPEEKRASADNVVGEPKIYADEPAPTPKATPATPKFVSVNFETEPLFGFDKSVVRADQRGKLDELISSLDGAEITSITVIGHTDRIGPNAYNKKLSDRRAASVKNYLVSKGIPADRIHTEGRGKSEPVTGDTCKKERGNKLISCLQPDRRVDVGVSASKRTN